MKTDESSSHSTDVLICGAGPTGLMLANLLAREKVSFRIVEADSERHKESRALAIQPRTMELFQSLGLIDRFLEQGVRGKGISVYVEGSVAAQINFSDIGRSDTPFGYLFFLSQSATEAILEDSLNSFGVKVERQTKLVSFEKSDSGVHAVLKKADGSEDVLSAQYLVGCDGARSEVRKSSGLWFAGGTYNSEFMLADAKLSWDLAADRIHILLGDKNMALIMPLKGSSLSRVITIGENFNGLNDVRENLVTRDSASVEDVQRTLQDASNSNVHLSDVEWVTKYRVHHRSADKMKIGRVFLAGDAAHIHSPAGGQGMNTGLQDAANLGWKLAAVLRGDMSDEILETYNSERWPVGQKLLRFTDRIFTAASSQSALAKKIRNFVVPIAGKLLLSRSTVRRYMFGFVSQLNIRYHASAVAIDDRTHETSRSKLARKQKIRSGCRAPDAKLSSGGTLFDLTSGYKFSVLAMSRHVVDTGERKRFEAEWRKRNLMGSANASIHWIDEANGSAALDTYGVDDVLVSLIRPDGYIGYQTERLA